MSGAEINGADGPGFGEHVRERGTEGGCTRVTGLQFVEAAREIAGETRFVHAKLFKDARKIAVGDVEELEKKMFDLDVVVSARQTKTGGGLEGIPGGVVQLADQTFQICRHDDLVSLNIENSLFGMPIHGL